MFVSFPNGEQKEFLHSITGRELVSLFDKTDDVIVGLRINNEVVSLNRHIDVDVRVEPVFLSSGDGAAMYRRTLCLLLASAAKRIYPDLRLLVGHSLAHGYYYTFENHGNENIDLKKIETEMQTMVRNDLPIENCWMTYESAKAYFETVNQPATLNLLEHLSKPKFLVTKLGDYQDLYFQPLLDRVGCLKVFELLPYDDGFLLRFPKSKTPNMLDPFTDIPKLFNIYKEYKNWGRLLGVTSVADLNYLIENRKIDDYIEMCEILQNNKIAQLTEDFRKKASARIILIAGPSSSGKTTFAKKLSLHLKVHAFNPSIISLDDFYLGEKKVPRDENGKPDFECLEALDLDLLNEILIDLLDGKEVDLPLYDFKSSSRRDVTKKFKLPKNGILILEGIHGINERLTAKVSTDLKYKIFLSALTQLNLDDHNRIPTSDNRLLRRIVRDAQFRGSPASKTISMWESVRSGENKHIFPFQNTADAFFNTALDYELPVLKVYAEPLLRVVKPTDIQYNEACRLLAFLQNFSPVPANAVPGRSIVREFIGNSSFSY
ncbi:MAG: nucleoside kinase [Spirochaetaceae bacterium]|nr:nucleoside kinase [Spirochaetaceae bacterium]